MAGGGQHQLAVLAQLRSRPAGEPRPLRQGGQHIQRGHGAGQAREVGAVLQHQGQQALELDRLQAALVALGAEQPLLEGHQLLRGEALGVGQGLLAEEVGRHRPQVGFGDLEVVAEHPVVLDLQAVDAGGGALFFFELQHHLLGVPGQAAHGVQLRIHAFADDAALLQVQGRSFSDDSLKLRK